MIGYVLKMYPRFSETFILAEVLELEARGCEVSIISLKKPDDGRFHEDLARVRAAVSYLPERFVGHPLRYLSAHRRAVARSPRRYLSALRIALAGLPHTWKAFLKAPLVAERAAARGCSRLHAHFASIPALTAMLAARMLGIPFSVTAHAKDIYHESHDTRTLVRLMREAEHVVTVTEFNKAHLESLASPPLPRDRVVRVFNHVDTTRFQPAERGPTNLTPLVLAVGRLVEKKGFVDLVRAAALLRARGVDFRCEIVGKGPLESALRAEIDRHELGECVSLEGPRSRGWLASKLPTADLLCAPCVIARDGNRDGLPTVILEAMASALPVVATPVTGIAEAVVDGETGRLVEPGNPESLADALQELLEDREHRRRLGAVGRARAVELFDTRRSIDQLVDLMGVEAQDSPLRPAPDLAVSAPEVTP